ncbi:unnamed protein product [Oikopleura dioica]|uniref:Cadherin domain-containing protein n=1 Tax=Oikopleura dioica TaxID=34765 RepID=E4XN14_OIKDI|nr:unnamed protein product [Oikopleura dioica]
MFSYSIGNSEEVPFDIDSQTGQLTTNRRLDFEAQENYKIEIVASPSIGPAGSGIVEINIIDKNDMKPRPSGSMTITYCVNNPSWSSNVNFTDPDYRASPKIDVRQNSRSSAWNGIELVLIESGAGWATLSIRTNDESRIAAGMKLPVTLSDGKFEEVYDLTVSTCSCNGKDSIATCSAIAGSPPMKAQLAVAVIVAVAFSLVTIIIFTAWRKRLIQKQFNCELPPIENFDDDIRENIVQYAEEAGEEPGPADYNLKLLQKETMQRGPKHVPKQSQYTDSLKKKVANASSHNHIAPYDSLQLYHYEGANSIFSSLSSIHSALTERSLNFSGMEAQPKMEKLMKLFESSDPFLDSRNLESISLNATVTRNPKKNLQVTCLEEADTGIDFDFRTDL